MGNLKGLGWTSIPSGGLGEVAILLVTSCWVSCDGLSSHQGGSCNTPNQFMLGSPVKDYHPIHAGYPVMDYHLYPGGSNCGNTHDPNQFMLGILRWTSITSGTRESSSIPCYFMLQKPQFSFYHLCIALLLLNA